MRTALVALALGVLAGTTPMGFAATDDDVIDAVNEFADAGSGRKPPMPGFSHTICMGFGGNCVEGAILTKDVKCEKVGGIPSCNATNCSGTGSAYRCDIKYTYQLCLRGVGLNPQDPVRPPLYVEASGGTEDIPTFSFEGIVWSCQWSAPFTRSYPNIPVEGLDVQIHAHVGIAMRGGMFATTKHWETVVIHLPPPETAALLHTSALVSNPVGVLSEAVAGVDDQAADYVASYEGWDPTPITVVPGPTPSVDPEGALDTVLGLAWRVVDIVEDRVQIEIHKNLP